MYSFETQEIACLKAAKSALITKILSLGKEHQLHFKERLNTFSSEQLMDFYGALERHIQSQMSLANTMAYHKRKTLKRRKTKKSKSRSETSAPLPTPPPSRKIELPPRQETERDMGPALDVNDIVVTEGPLFEVAARDTTFCQSFEPVQPAGPKDVQNLLKLARMAFSEDPTITILKVNDQDANIFR